VNHLQARIFVIAWRTMIAGICMLGIRSSWNLARADYLFRMNTEESLRAAIRLEPDAWKYYMRLALFDDANAQQLLETAIKDDPYNAEADIELGLRLEAAGNYPRAEKLLLDAFAVDRTFVPRWTLANYYFRRNNLTAFWTWARSAAEMPSDSTGPLFELCWHVSPDPKEIEAKILNNNPEIIRQYLGFLLAKNQLPAAAEVADRLVQTGDRQTDTPQMFSLIDGLIAANEGGAAQSVWNELIQKHWIVADSTAPNNPNFSREPLPVRFDWAISSGVGLHSWPGPSGLETEFSGEQPENCTIAEQAIVLAPGNYQVVSSYRTQGIAPETGLRWQVVPEGSDKVLAESADLSSETPSRTNVAFSISSQTSLVRLRLQYERTIGTPRISGTLVISLVQIQAR
jgi:hypothetical protein